MLCDDTIHAANRPETEGSPRKPALRLAHPAVSSCTRLGRFLLPADWIGSCQSVTTLAAHHGCGLSRDVTTKSVRSLPQLEQRNRSCVSGTSLHGIQTALASGAQSRRAATRHPYILQPRIVRHVEKIVLRHLTPHYHNKQGEQPCCSVSPRITRLRR